MAEDRTIGEELLKLAKQWHQATDIHLASRALQRLVLGSLQAAEKNQADVMLYDLANLTGSPTSLSNLRGKFGFKEADEEILAVRDRLRQVWGNRADARAAIVAYASIAQREVDEAVFENEELGVCWSDGMAGFKNEELGVVVGIREDLYARVARALNSPGYMKRCTERNCPRPFFMARNRKQHTCNRPICQKKRHKKNSHASYHGVPKKATVH
jgi:hypothetical protein